MSSIAMQCTQCESDFEVEIVRLIDRPTILRCPNCGNKPVPQRCEGFATALEDLVGAMAGIRNKVRFELNLDTDELPPPYGAIQPEEASSLGGEMDDEDEDEYLEEETSFLDGDDDDDDDYDPDLDLDDEDDDEDF